MFAIPIKPISIKLFFVCLFVLYMLKLVVVEF